MSKPSSWTLEIDGSADDPSQESVMVVRHDPLPQINLTVHAPELASVVGEEQVRLARQVIQDAVNAIQAALDGSALPGHIQ
jgi:hypothetical protein